MSVLLLKYPFIRLDAVSQNGHYSVNLECQAQGLSSPGIVTIHPSRSVTFQTSAPCDSDEVVSQLVSVIGGIFVEEQKELSNADFKKSSGDDRVCVAFVVLPVAVYLVLIL